jgi:hypothetical protein
MLVPEDLGTCFGLSFMSDFVTSLVREKIVFLPQEAEGGDATPTVIRSNRIYLRLVKGDVTDNVVIRAQNMADTLRMAARVVEDHMWKGPFKTRKPPWGSMWQQAVSLYGAHFNAENNWVAVYIDGKNVYETTKSPFTDVVERCALATLYNYDETLKTVETVMDKLEKPVQIKHSANIAAIFRDSGEATRTSLMHRGETRQRSFHFTAEDGEAGRIERIAACFAIAGAFLEAIEISILLANPETALASSASGAHSGRAERLEAARQRQSHITHAVNSFENRFTVNYRPEKPDFL